MPMTEQEKQEFDQSCYGMSEEDVREHLEPQSEMMGRDMLVTSMMSDAQHLMEIGHAESARQLLNRAKWVLGELERNKIDDLMDKHRKGEIE